MLILPSLYGNFIRNLLPTVWKTAEIVYGL